MSARTATAQQHQAAAVTRRGAGGYGAAASGSTGRYAPAQQYRREPAVHYTVSHVGGTEVLTLEDTPEPAPAAVASSSRAQQDPYAGYGAPPAKKRKSDVGTGGYAAPQYAAPPAAANAYYGQAGAAYAQQYAQPAASGSGTKRKATDYDNDNRQTQKAKDGPPYHDAEGHFVVRVGGEVTDRDSGAIYKIEKLLGQGTFGKVVSATEFVKDKHGKPKAPRKVALKIIRAVHKYQEAAKTEIKVLRRLRDNNAKGDMKCIRLEATFDFHGHPCIVTPLLSCSVFDFLKENSYEPFPLSHVQSFAKQLLTSLSYVHGQRLIHTDLKPENILLEDGAFDLRPNERKPGKSRKILRNTSLQLIDFGSATFEHDYHATVVSTRHYRAPEIILNLGWNYPCDMWSIGCILVEFITGEALFQTHDNHEHLAMMERVFGPMPTEMARAGSKSCPEGAKWFKRQANGRSRSGGNYILNFPTANTEKSSAKFVKGMKTLREIIYKNAGADIAGQRFLELCEGLLKWDVRERLSVQAALNHPFFQLATIHDDGNPAPARR
ncbi:hypothetical protein JCM10213_006233 [Rhodosporidiobolus nylandii]